ncbi:MAG: Gldg family protein [Candidatus Krumholzibacteria bacterium]|nr:Gldg family protein [Candidatus Krumholzibacteria bacterium]
MRQLQAIISRETGAFFKSSMAPVVLSVFLVAVGLFFTIFLYGYSDMSLAALQSPRSGNFMNLAEGLFRPMVSNTIFFLMFLMPALTMRLFAPEFGSGRFDLIASWPVADHIWVLGKWMSAWLTAGVMILAGMAYFGVVWFLGSPEIGPAAVALVGELLFVGCLVAWGTLASTMFKQQMVAYFLAFIWSMFLFMIGALERYLPGMLGTITHELSLLFHFERFSRGVADTRDILYFVLMMILPLFAATAVVAGRRMPAKRRLVLWTPTLLATVLAVVVYVLGQTWVGTWDLTGNKRYSLAPQTLQVLDSLPENLANLKAEADSVGGPFGDLDKVQVLAFYQRLDPARDITETLLKACAQRSNRFKFKILDPDTELELLRRYQIKATRTVVVKVGDRYTSLLQPEESALASAVYRLSTGKLARICQLLGHGEHLVNSDDRSGYSSYELLLMDQGYDVRPLYLSETRKVPDSCDVLVIAGPKLEPEPDELEAIETHLAKGGAVMAMFDPPTPSGWVNWMAKWRVGLTGDVLIAVERVGSERGISARTIVVDEGYGDHEVVSSLVGMPTIYPLVQTLTMVGEPDSTVAGAIILASSDQTWSETDPDTRFMGRPSYNRDVDGKGPLPFGMVLEIQLGAEGTPPGRMMVIGNSEFLNNANINLAGNSDLMLNAIGWLAREEGLIQIRGKDPLSQPVILSPDAKNVLGWGSILGWPLFVGSLALGFMLMKRREKGGTV